MRGDGLDKLIAAVADGRSIDWERIETTLSDDERFVARVLRRLSVPSPVREPRASPASWIAAAAMLAAAAVGIGGLIGYALAWPDLPALAWLFVAADLVFGGAAAWLLVVAAADRRAFALAGVFWTVAAAFATAGTRALAAVLGVPILGLLRPEAFLPAFLWQFARDFPSTADGGRLAWWCRTGTVLARALGVILFAGNAVLPWLNEHAPRIAAVVDGSSANDMTYWQVVFAACAPALVLLGLRAWGGAARDAGQVRAFLATVILALAPITIEMVLEGLLPRYRAFVRVPPGRWFGAAFVYPTLLAFPFISAHVVLTYSVLDIRRAAHRAVQYVFTRWVLGTGVALPAVLLLGVVFRNRARPLVELFDGPQVQGLAWVAGFGLVLLAVRPVVLRLVDRILLREVSDPSVVLADLSSRLGTCRTPGEVVDVTAGALARVFHATATPQVVERAPRAAFPSAPATLIPVLLDAMPRPCLVDPQRRGSYFDLLTAQDQAWIREQQVEVLCPVHVQPDVARLGFVALGESRRSVSFTTADLRFMTAVCGTAQMAAAATARFGQPMATPADDEELAWQCPSCQAVVAWDQGATACPCGGTWRRASLPRLVLNRYRLVRALGAGAMGVVYLAADTLLERQVALKTLPALSQEAAERTLREARVMASLQHPGLATLFGIEHWRTTPLLVEEYLEGGTLHARLRGGPLPVAEALAIGIRLADALAYLHGCGVRHGDIKPSNIGFSGSLAPKLLDFGVSVPQARLAASDGPLEGTLAYLPPDVLEGHPPDEHADVWALSVVLWEAVFGRHPFMGADFVRQVRRGEPQPAPPRDPRLTGVSTTHVAALRALISPQQQERPSSAAALGERLRLMEAASSSVS